MIRYKLTDPNDCTYGGCQWGEGTNHTAPGDGPLCSRHFIHVYTDPLLAVLLNPIHGNFASPKLWECEVAGECTADHGLKEGWTSVTTIRRLELPEITTEQRVRFAILCSLAVYSEPGYVAWAQGWLEDRDRSAADAAAADAAAWAADAAAWAAAIDLVALARQAVSA